MIGGAACTSWTCPICKKDQMSGSTVTGYMCLSCADERNECYMCGKKHKEN